MQIDTTEAFNKGIKEYLGLAKYELIRTTYNKYNLTTPEAEDFRTLFNGYYRLRYKKEVREKFYEVFQKVKEEKTKRIVTYEEIICKIFSSTNGRVEKVFASKILATFYPEKPILDSRVENYLRKIGIRIDESREVIIDKWFKDGILDQDKKRLISAIEEYHNLEDWYNTYIKSEEGIKVIGCFDKAFPEYKHFTKQRKIDYFLWLLG